MLKKFAEQAKYRIFVVSLKNILKPFDETEKTENAIIFIGEKNMYEKMNIYLFEK